MDSPIRLAVPRTLRARRWLAAVVALLAACKPVRALDPDDVDTRPPIGLDEARAVFAEAAALCGADAAQTWGVSLCGPMMVVDRDTRFVVANQADVEGQLRARGGVFVGTLPPKETIANSELTWAGVHWVQLGWPLPTDRGERGVLMMHEQFHRIASQLSVAVAVNPNNGHLDSIDGRYYLQLEWRALAAALRATSDGPRRAAIADALAFRHARRSAFPSNEASEDALELQEGLAQYTGVVVAHTEPAARLEAALRDLSSHTKDPSLVRSFAYATGPSYGLLLDQLVPGWRTDIGRTRSLSDTLAAALSTALPEAGKAATRYDGAALRAAEDRRADERASTIAQYRRLLVDGPVVTLAFQQMKIELNPSNVVPLDDLGSVYPTVRIIDDWGVLEVSAGGALVKSDWSAVVVSAPNNISIGNISGAGWKLALASSWTLIADQRPGDFRVSRTAK